jgi:hypothetical protein
VIRCSRIDSASSISGEAQGIRSGYATNIRALRGAYGDLYMSQPAKAQEPSMEEILASIRRIIADDEGKPAAKRRNP